MRQKDFVKIAPLFSPIGRNFSPKLLYSLYTQNLVKGKKDVMLCSNQWNRQLK
mgnify:CR=1 FL=1